MFRTPLVFLDRAGGQAQFSERLSAIALLSDWTR